MEQPKIKMYKRYSDGDVHELEINDTIHNVRALMDQGFFLTAAEAETGEVAAEPVKKPAAKKPAAKKPAAKK